MTAAEVSARGTTRRSWLTAVALITLAVLAALIWNDDRQAWATPEREYRVVFKLMLYWGSWLFWPAMAWLVAKTVRGLRQQRWLVAFLMIDVLVVCSCLAWARFIEPNMLLVRETTVSASCGVKVALISDLHMGLFMRNHDLQRVVDRLNTLDVDAVLVAGDWTFEPAHDLPAVFAPLAQLKHRTIAVMGNHDEEFPGPPLKQALQSALSALNVQVIDGQRTTLGRCELVGLGDLGAGSAAPQLKALLAQPSAAIGAQRVVLTHNPDTAFILPQGFAAVTLAGHTHGGQVDIPRITERLLNGATRGKFRQGLYALRGAKVFVSSGIGIDKLPLRFRVPPQIDVLRL